MQVWTTCWQETGGGTSLKLQVQRYRGGYRTRCAYQTGQTQTVGRPGWLNLALATADVRAAVLEVFPDAS